MKKYFFPLVLLAVFEAVAVVLWLTRDNLFYLFNFSYIGVSVSLGVFLFVKKYRHARRIVQLLVGLYMLVYLGLIRVKCDESKCISCGKCRKVCPMEVDILDPSKRRKNGTECILCLECKRNCPVDAL